MIVGLLVCVLGGVGAATRYLVDAAVTRRRPSRFPLGTLAVNVSGSFLIGLLAVLAGSQAPGTFAVLATGFCGGYTTFSTAMVETVRLAQEGAWAQAVGHSLGTLLLCAAAASAGVAIAAALT